MNEQSAAERARAVTSFIVDVIEDAEVRMRIHETGEAVLSYPRERIALLKTCREQVEAMLEWKDHVRRTTALEDGLSAIAAVRATAHAAGERISIAVTQNIVRQLRGVVSYLVEYEVLKERDGQRGGRRR